MEAAFALAGVVIGAALTLAIQNRQGARDVSLSARLELPVVRSAVWAPQPLTALREVIGRSRARARLLRVDQQAVDRLEEVSRRCWDESREHWEQYQDVEAAGISVELSRELDDAVNALDEAFERAGKRWRL